MPSFVYKQLERIAYARLLLSLAAGALVTRVLILLAPLLRRRSPSKDFLFFPYTHKDNIGTLSRVQDFLPLFARDGFRVDVRYPCSRALHDHVFFGPRRTRAREYRFLRRLFWQRLREVLAAPDYKAVFFQRAAFPYYYDQRRAVLERLLHALHDNVTVDFFDADYARNEPFYLDVIRQCNKVAVVNESLRDYFSRRHARVYTNDLSIDASRYHTKKDYALNKPVRIFWTGSLTNAAQNLVTAMPALEALNRERPLVLVMVAPSRAGFTQPFIEHHLWNEKSFFELMATSDIALYPVAKDDAFSRGKVAYKTLEYMASKVPMVASPQGLSSRLVNGDDVLVVNNPDDWKKQINKLIDDEALRRRMAESAYEKFMRYHDINATYKNLLNILKG